MKSRRSSQPAYSIIAPVYNLELYLDAFFTSLAEQTFDFAGRVEVICVDDGSDDASPEILERWQSAYPNIRSFRKKNGGRASARNFGLAHATGDWVTFIDPDDFIDRRYFEEVDTFLQRPQSAAVGMLCCRRFFHNDFLNTVRDTHYLRHQFLHGPRWLPASHWDGFMEPSNSSVFYKRSILFDEGIRNKEDIRPFFEDTEMNIFYMLALRDKDMSIGVLPSAVYYYRIRTQVSSFIDSMKNYREFYDELFDNGYIRTLERVKEKAGAVPLFVQKLVITSLAAQAQYFSSSYGACFYQRFTEREQLLDRMEKTLSYCDAEVVLRGDGRQAPDPVREFMAERFCGLKRSCTWIHVQKYDPFKLQLKLSYRGRQVAGFFQGDKKLVPAFHKRRLRNFLDEALEPEQIFWLPLGDLETPLRVEGLSPEGRFALNGQDMGGACSVRELVAALLPDCVRQATQSANLWLFCDTHTHADDNAEHLYWYVKEQHPEIDARFLLSPLSGHWERMRSLGAVLVAHGTEEHIQALSQCSHLIASHPYCKSEADGLLAGRGMAAPYRFVYLKHGYFKSDMSSGLPGGIDCFLAGTRKEYESIAGDDNHYPLTKKEVVLTGLPRTDALLRSRLKPERLIMVMPTWRSALPTLADNEERFTHTMRETIEQSAYCKHWKNFLCSPATRAILEEHKYRLLLWPHKKLGGYLSLFSLPDYIEVHSKESLKSIQKAFHACSIFITDYSSAAFDTALLRRYIIYYQFDSDVHLDGTHNMTVQDSFLYVRDGFGPVAYAEEDLLDMLKNACLCEGRMSSLYSQRVDMSFPYQDTNNCKRVFDSIVTMRKR